ncbi:MAG: hypothetical protein KDJ16_06950 [Hyphomicrobiales bacterium]|nr:hypothetical protein [Hyphomicrobiales bacterium]
MTEIAATLALVGLIALTALIVWFGRRYFVVGAPSRDDRRIVAALAELKTEVERTNALLERLTETGNSKDGNE